MSDSKQQKSTNDSELPLLIFAKAPIPGKVKTRLQSNCNEQQAADIAKILLVESLENACSHWPGRVYLSVGLDHQHEFIQALQRRYEITLVTQSQGDLGLRMHRSFESHGYPCAIMGSDAPHITPASLRSAYKHLLNQQAVIGPSEDGGYYFIGLAEPCPSLFTDIKWGEEAVLQNTLIKAREKSLILNKLPALNDVDTWQDLLQVSKQSPSLNNYIKRQNLG